ncbi:MAG: PKD domain-containing protein [Caldiserica bacterium]|nr:PKD domain-containing protein [Caldisericota bacterium]
MKRKLIVLGALAVLVVLGLTACTIFMSLPEAVIEAVPQMGPAPLEVTFDISKSKGQVYTLDFGDGSPTTSGTDFTAPIVHTYGDPGDYVATLTVEDTRGNTDTATVTIKVQYPPLMAVLDVTVQTPPYTFAFDASGSVGEIDRYVLYFGDGDFIAGDWATATWPVYHTYPAQTESYVATLWIEDIYGQDDSTMEVVETPAP